MYEGNPRYVWTDDGAARREGPDPAAELSHLLNEQDPAYRWITQTLLIFSASGIALTAQSIEMAIKVGTYEHRIAEESDANRGTKPDQDGGVVYYVRRGSMIKIGTTISMPKRMLALLPDEILATEPGSYRLEAQRHREFSSLRVQGHAEWFHAGPQLQEHVHGIRALHGEPDPTLPILRSS